MYYLLLSINIIIYLCFFYKIRTILINSVLYLESLDELEQMVVELFSQVKNKDITVPTWPEHPFNSKQHFQNRWYIVPIKDIRNLYIIFPIPDLRKHYKSAVITIFILFLNILIYCF